MVLSRETPGYTIKLREPGREIEAILFDMDGVLADTIPAHIQAWNYALRENHLPELDRETYLVGLGRTNLDMLTGILELFDVDMPLATKKSLVVIKERFFREIIRENIKTTPGVMDWLDFFKKKQIRCSVASSGEMANITLILDALHISDYFTSIISGAKLPATKPDPMIFKLAAASLGAEPCKCLVIEDAPAGIKAAKSAGMACCAMATTLPFDQLQQADILLENLSRVSPENFFSD
jgi:HAD superfamily hydrolase (TIGR01509 family)